MKDVFRATNVEDRWKIRRDLESIKGAKGLKSLH